MTEKVKVKLITPTKLEVEAEAEMVIVPGVKGSFALLSRRAPIISHIEYGMLLLCDNRDVLPNKNDAGKRFFIGSGIVEASNDNCVILVDEAIATDKVDKTVVASRISDGMRLLKDETYPAKAKEKLKITIAYLEMILDTLERENPRPVIKGR
ncbi:MAG: ATP synthase epsilon chain [Alphaproteobacteria bacterium ADurb.Bin438]|nr:MAG: ATP synthase epsilon chain [Alphaproteobacteria bacterium ADurb.Bin438]